MKRIKRKIKIKLSTKLIFIGGLIIFFTFFLTNSYLKKVNPQVIEVAKAKLNKMAEQFLSVNIGYDILKDNVLDDILIITQNDEGEILYVDYNLENAYKVLDVVTTEIASNLNNLESGQIDLEIEDNNLISNNNGLVLGVPLFIASDNTFLSNLGPKVYVKVNFVGSILTNIKSKVTNYGMNNALLELYVTVEITEELISPVIKEEQKIYYDVLIAAKVINGRVPTFYSGTIEKESTIYSQNLE